MLFPRILRNPWLPGTLHTSYPPEILIFQDFCQCFLNFAKFGVTQTKLNMDTSLAAKGALANRLQRRTAGKIQNGRQGAPKWQRGSGKVSTPRFLGILRNFR